MKLFMAGMILGSVLTGLMVEAQNVQPDFYGRPQWGKQITPPYDAFGRPNFTEPPGNLPMKKPC